MTSISITSSADKILKKDLYEKDTGFVFFLFCLWAFVVLCRPQDVFPVLDPLRPALTMAILTLGMVAIRYKNFQYPFFFQERQIKHYTALLMVMVVGIPFSLYISRSFTEIFTGYINVILFVFIFYKLVSSVKRLSIILLIGCLGSGLYSVFALLEFVPGMGRLAFGSMFDPNDIGFFVLGFLPLNLIFISRDNPLWIRLACSSCLVMGMLVIFYSGSRGGMLSFGVAATLLILSRTHVVKLPAKAFFVTVCLLLVSFSSIDTERYSTLLSLEQDYNVYDETGRIELWKIGAKAMLNNPFTGVGVGNYSYAVGLERQARGSGTLKWQTAHNSPIQIGAETGVLGFVLFLLISLNVWRILNRTKKKASQERLVKIAEMGIIGFVGLFVAGLFLSQAYSFYWAFYVAVSAVVSNLLVRDSAAQDKIANNEKI